MGKKAVERPMKGKVRRQRLNYKELLSGDWMLRISCTVSVATIFCTWRNGGLRRMAVKKLGQASEDLVK